MTNAFIRDLSAHLSGRINQAIDDFADRCEVVDIDVDRAETGAITVLGCQLACLVLAHGADEAQFVELCRWHFRNAQKRCEQQEVA